MADPTPPPESPRDLAGRLASMDYCGHDASGVCDQFNPSHRCAQLRCPCPWPSGASDDEAGRLARWALERDDECAVDGDLIDVWRELVHRERTRAESAERRVAALEAALREARTFVERWDYELPGHAAAGALAHIAAALADPATPREPAR